jgi:hypothetical protein
VIDQYRFLWKIQKWQENHEGNRKE